MRPSNTTENTYATETWYMISWNTGQCIRWRWFICDNNNISRLINRSGCRRVEARPFRGALSSLTLISPLLSSPPVMSQRWPRVCQNWYSGPSYHKPINHSECTFCIGAERRCWKFLTSKERLLTVSFFPMFVGVTQFVSLSNFALPSCVPAPRAGHRSRTFPSPLPLSSNNPASNHSVRLPPLLPPPPSDNTFRPSCCISPCLFFRGTVVCYYPSFSPVIRLTSRFREGKIAFA